MDDLRDIIDKFKGLPIINKALIFIGIGGIVLFILFNIFGFFYLLGLLGTIVAVGLFALMCGIGFGVMKILEYLSNKGR